MGGRLWGLFYLENKMEMTLIAMIMGYFIPTFAAMNRRHKNKAAIITLNIIAGWTLIGWVVAMVWAMTSNVEPFASAEVEKY